MIYVDGFNLYFGMKESGCRKHYWLNVHSLATKLVESRGLIPVATKYFTSRIDGAKPSDPPQIARERDEKRNRQTTFLDALGTLGNVQIIEGKFLTSNEKCYKCKAMVKTPREKMTDVNIATELLVDAFQDKFDVAYVVSGDSDLAPPIVAVRQHFKTKSVYVAFPPSRFSKHLSTVATGYFRINEPMLRASQLPDEIKFPSGVTLRRPPSWR